MKAPQPDNEPRRLEALRSYDILDTPGDQAFDDLTLLAAHICGVPTAMVSLVDENRQWFKSKLGMSASETSRDIAFCAHTILRPDEVLEVRDAEADPRFADSPLVTADPHIRFYAGAPLVSPSGHALGALCVMDRRPRTLEPAQRDALRALSRRVVAQLELRRQARALGVREQEASRLLELAEKSRRALLSVLEDEKLATRQLRESEERFRGLIENASDMIAIIDEGGVIRFQSPSTPRHLGHAVNEMEGRPAIEFIHPDDRGKVAEAIGTAMVSREKPVSVEFRIRHRNGSWRVLQSVGKRMLGDAGQPQIVVNSRDVTESRALEQQFLHAQRMEAIGTLASGVAHDLNNILSPVMMVAGLLRMKENLTAKDDEMLSMIERSGQRGADIIRQLLTFSRSIPGERGPVQPKHLIREMTGIMKETFPRNIAIKESIPASLWTIEADPTQLHQVLMNLCVNARDAMAQGGTLTVGAENVPWGPLEDGQKQGPCVLLQVADTGSGIPPEIIGRIFEPFFTTKGPGKGTGLGLSTVVGIVRGHGGTVKVDSVPGRGTTFRIHLPASAGQSGVEADRPAMPTATGRGELILVVDDEELIRDATSDLLRYQGYRVLVAPSGEAAVRVFIEHLDTVRVVVTDVMMPGMDGMALLRALQTLRPSIRVVVASGLAQTLDRDAYAAVGVTDILAKPFTPEQLIAAIGRALAK